MVRIEGASSALINLRNAPKVTPGSSKPAETVKNFGETPPVALSMSEIGALASLFSTGGMVSKLKRRLNKLKDKKCRVIPAKGTIACVDSNDLVYLGVDFLREYHAQEDVIAGVMAHEWGHTCTDRPTQKDLKQLNWDEIFDLRRSHETLADEISGRLLALMGYRADRLIEFLKRDTGRTHNHKYHDVKTRAQIILNGWRDEVKKIKLANQVFPKQAYSNQYHSILIDEG